MPRRASASVAPAAAVVRNLRAGHSGRGNPGSNSNSNAGGRGNAISNSSRRGLVSSWRSDTSSFRLPSGLALVEPAALLNRVSRRFLDAELEYAFQEHGGGCGQLRVPPRCLIDAKGGTTGRSSITNTSTPPHWVPSPDRDSTTGSSCSATCQRAARRVVDTWCTFSLQLLLLVLLCCVVLCIHYLVLEELNAMLAAAAVVSFLWWLTSLTITACATRTVQRQRQRSRRRKGGKSRGAGGSSKVMPASAVPHSAHTSPQKLQQQQQQQQQQQGQEQQQQGEQQRAAGSSGFQPLHSDNSRPLAPYFTANLVAHCVYAALFTLALTASVFVAGIPSTMLQGKVSLALHWRPSVDVSSLHGAALVMLLPLLGGLDHMVTVAVHLAWFIGVAAVLVARYADTPPRTIYSAALWAVLVALVGQVVSMRITDLFRSRWFVRTVLDGNVVEEVHNGGLPSALSSSDGAPASDDRSFFGSRFGSRMPMDGSDDSLARAFGSNASRRNSSSGTRRWRHQASPGSGSGSIGSPATPSYRAPVLERLASQITRIQRRLRREQDVEDLQQTLDLLYQYPDLLTAGHEEELLQHDFSQDDSARQWLQHSLVRRLPMSSEARGGGGGGGGAGSGNGAGSGSGRARARARAAGGVDDMLADREEMFDGVVGRKPGRRRHESFRGLAIDLPIATTRSNTALRSALSKVTEWNFDIFQLAQVTQDRPLATIMMHLFSLHGLVERHSIPEATLVRFLNRTEWEYCYDPEQRNSYHTSLHAADVVQATAVILKYEQFQSMTSDVDVLAVLLAACLHDFRHPGVSNNYLIATKSKLAIRYNDVSVLENYHAAEAFQSMQNTKYNILAQLDRQDRLTVRYTIIQCILATDLAQGQRYLSAFEARAKRDDFGDQDADKLLVMQLAIKCADVSHPARAFRFHARWSSLIAQEFYAQGDMERGMGMPVSPLCDRNNHNLSKSQVGFIKFVVRPCFEPLSEFCNEPLWLRTMAANAKRWRNDSPTDSADSLFTNSTSGGAAHATSLSPDAASAAATAAAPSPPQSLSGSRADEAESR